MNNSNKQLDKLIELFNSSLFEEALDYGLNLSENNPNNPIIYNLLGAIYLSLNSHDLALKQFEKALTLSPNFVEAHINIANLFKEKKLYDKSLFHYNTALNINPNLIIGYLNKGNLLKDNSKYKQAIECYLKAINLKKDFIEAYNNLGTAYESLNQFDKAIKSYKTALSFNDKFIPANKNLANLLYKLDFTDKALKYYEKLNILSPNDPSIQHLIKSLKADNAATFNVADDYVNVEHVKNVFNSKAENFDNLLVNELGYNAPLYLLDLLKHKYQKLPRFKKAIDLGCGTGISGSAFRDITDYLVGVDISDEMISVARQKKIYDELIIGEVNETIHQKRNTFDLLICTDVFIYIGNLNKIFNNISEYLKNSGLFLFCTERNDEEIYKLNTSGRYSHSHKYIMRLLEDNDFKLLSEKKGNLRKERGKWIEGGFYIARKK